MVFSSAENVSPHTRTERALHPQDEYGSRQRGETRLKYYQSRGYSYGRVSTSGHLFAARILNTQSKGQTGDLTFRDPSVESSTSKINGPADSFCCWITFRDGSALEEPVKLMSV